MKQVPQENQEGQCHTVTKTTGPGASQSGIKSLLYQSLLSDIEQVTSFYLSFPSSQMKEAIQQII